MDTVEDLQRSSPGLTGWNAQELMLGTTRRPPLGTRRDIGGPSHQPPRGEPPATARQWPDSSGVDPITQGFDRIMARFDQLEFILDARDRRVGRLEARRLPEPDQPYFSDYADLDGYRFQRDVWTADEDVPRNFNHDRRDRGGDIRRQRGTVRVTHRPEGSPPRHGAAAAPYRACLDSWHGSSWDRPVVRYTQGPDRGFRSYQQPTSWGSPINRPNHGTVRIDRPKDLTVKAPRTTENSLGHQEPDDQRLHRIEEVEHTVIVVTDHNVDDDHSDQTCSELLMTSEIIIDDDIKGVGYDMEQAAQVQALTVTILPREGPTDQVDKDIGGPGSIPTIMSNFDIANSLCDKDEEEVPATWDLDGSTRITRSTTDESDRDGHEPLHCLSRGKNVLYVEGTSITPMVDHEHHHSRDNICGYGVVSNDDKVVPDAELPRDAITDAGVFLLLKSSQLRRVPVVLESLSELGTIIINVDGDRCRRGSADNMLGLMMNDWGRPSQEHEFSIGGSALGGNFHFDAAWLEAQGRGSNYACITNLKHSRRLAVGLGHKLNMSIGWKVVLGMTLVGHESTRRLYPATLNLDLEDLIYQFAVWMTPHQWEDVKQLWLPHTPERVNKCEINWTRRGHRLTKLQYYAGRPNGVGFIGLFCVEVSDFADQFASRQGEAFQKKCLGIYYCIAYAYDIISLCCMLWNGVLIDVQQAQQFPGVGVDNYITLSYFDFDKDKRVYIIILVGVEVVQRIGPVAYKLRLPEGSRIHDVFHVSLLRAFVKDDPVVLLPEDFIGNRPVAKPVAILDSKILWHKGAAVEHVLVLWSDGTDSPSWEPLADLRKKYPTLSLEDKEVSKDGGVVTNSTDSGASGVPSNVAMAEPSLTRPTSPTANEEESSTGGGLDEQSEGAEEVHNNISGRKLRPRREIKQPGRYKDFVAK